MGRPKAFDRDQAVVTVTNKIWKDGYEASSVKSISQELGISRSSFYNAFDSREGLFLEVLKAYCEIPPHSKLLAIDGKTGVLKDLSSVIKAICKARIKDKEARGCLAVNSITELSGTNETIGPTLKNIVLSNVERFEKMLELAVEIGELEEQDLHAKALALQNMIFGLNVMSKIIRNEKELWAMAKHSLQALDLYSK